MIARLSLVVLAYAGLCAASTARAVTIERSAVLPHGGGDLFARHDGSIDVLSSTGGAGDQRLLIERWPARGPLRSSIGGPIPRATLYGRRSVALTRGGAVAAVDVFHERKHRIAVRSYGRRGQVVRTQFVSPPGMSAQEPVVVTGGGAVGVTFYARNRETEAVPRLMWAFRPSGAARFQPARALDRPAGYGLIRYSAAIGPAGDGAAFASSELGGRDPEALRVRRLSADGGLGPWIAVGEPASGFVTPAVAVGADSTVALAYLTEGPDEDGARTVALRSSSLPRGTDTPTPVQELHRGRDSSVLYNGLSVAIGAANQTLVTMSGRAAGERILLFTGTAGQLVLDASFEARSADTAIPLSDVSASVTDDGGGTVVWSSAIGYGTGPLYASHRPPGGRFEPPRVIARSSFTDKRSSIRPRRMISTGAGRVAVVIDDYGNDNGRSRLVLLVP